MASNIPKAREILHDVIRMTTDSKTRMSLFTALKFMARRSAIKAPVKSKPMSISVITEIKALREADPTLHYSEIAHRVGVNPGRVSEVLNS